MTLRARNTTRYNGTRDHSRKNKAQRGHQGECVLIAGIIAQSLRDSGNWDDEAVALAVDDFLCLAASRGIARHLLDADRPTLIAEVNAALVGGRA